MATKTTDWRPGPTVCRCCLSEGCYKDISTEYFWMGKREVYAEMLSDTFSLSIAYSQSGGPNSNSRLICEPCISRLRDASDFRRQVQECEKTFMQYLDPGTSIPEIEAPIESLDTQVKVERVKQEKDASEDDYEPAAADYDDDDDDDLDDQPLTKLASKIPKKESVDLSDLLDNAKAGEKRKAPAKAKAPAAKKARTKKEAKATTSTSKPKVEKKKKGKGSSDTVKKENEVTPNKGADQIDEKKLSRISAASIIYSSAACPFKWWHNFYICFYCDEKYLNIADLERHNTEKHTLDEKQILNKFTKIGRYQRVKVNFRTFSCALCSHIAKQYVELKEHLSTEHKKTLDVENDGILPFIIDDDKFACALCPDSTFRNYRLLCKHMDNHFVNHFCEQCGVGFATRSRMGAHVAKHKDGMFKCEFCEKVFKKSSVKNNHVQRVHMHIKKHRCPHCFEKFAEYRQRLLHMIEKHDVKPPEFKCEYCPKVFMLSDRRHQHMKVTHWKTKKHECTICHKMWSNAALLKNHMLTHSGEKNYECQICKKKYGRKNTLVEHMRIHNNDRRFACEHCGSRFVQKCSLQGHIRTHHRSQDKS